MMRRMVAILLLAPFSAGCFWLVAGGAGAAGAYAWINGNLSRNYKQPMETTWEGSLHALRKLKLKVTEQKHDAFNGYIKVKLVKGDVVKLSLERWTNNETKVTVRVGALGDRDISMRVHEQIEKELR